MKGMRNLNKPDGHRQLPWILTLFLFGIICIGVGFVVAANFDIIPKTQAENVPTSSGLPSPGQEHGLNFLQATQESFRAIIGRAKPAVVTIETKKEMKGIQFDFQTPDNFFFFDPFQPFQKREKGEKGEEDKNYTLTGGSGFFVSSDGYILTNNHVVSDSVQINVITDDQRSFTAELVGTDPMTDVALLKITNGENFPFLELGNSENSQVGDWVIAIGSPIKLAQTVTVGVISGKNREDVQIGGIDYSNFIQTDAAINFGNSGGPLLDINAKVIGINTAIAGGANVTGIGFAIPSNLARFAYENLKTHGEVIRGYIGVTIQQVDADIAKSYGLPKPTGALVNSVVKDDPADKAGIKVGDLILDIDGKEVTSHAAVSRIIAEKPVGKDIVLTILRNGKTMDVKVTPLKRPEDLTAKVMPGVSQPPVEKESKIGLSITNLTPKIREELNVPADVDGVVITKIKKNSKAAEKGLFMYDIISEADNKQVSSTGDFEKTLEYARDVILLKVYRQDLTGGNWRSFYIAIPLE
jgi:serine protease Do